MRPLRPVLVVLAAGAAVALSASQALAITSYNSQPAPERTEVGAFVVLWDTNGDGVPDRLDWECSGTMVDADTYLTAAHCTSDWPAGTRFFVSLDQDFQSELDSAPGTGEQKAAAMLAAGEIVEGDAHQDPAYPGPAADPHDVAVVDFADRAVTPADVWTFTPARLPSAGELDQIGSRGLDALDWTVVGYGEQQGTRGPGGHTYPGGGVRMKAPVDFNALTNAWVRLKQTAPQGNGGACYGDSGGPNFVDVDGTLVLAATTITGDTPCYATNVAYRMDTASARDFLAAYVDLP